VTSEQKRADARFRPFRVAVYSVFIAVILVFSLAITVSTVRSAIEMTPRHQPEASVVLTVRECADLAEALWKELEQGRQGLSKEGQAKTADQRWTGFRVEWMQRHRRAESTCAVESSSRTALKKVFTRLDKAMDLYTTHAVQYAGEVGPTIDTLREEIDGARRSVSN
jgi:hypothetical protein